MKISFFFFVTLKCSSSACGPRGPYRARAPFASPPRVDTDLNLNIVKELIRKSIEYRLPVVKCDVFVNNGQLADISWFVYLVLMIEYYLV